MNIKFAIDAFVVSVLLGEMPWERFSNSFCWFTNLRL